jgi:hypothetical protein
VVLVGGLLWGLGALGGKKPNSHTGNGGEKTKGKEQPANLDPAHPFIVLSPDGQNDTGLTDLAEAIKRSRAGGMIEVRGNGPFLVQGIDLGNKPLILRAGAGYQPVFRATLPLDGCVLRTSAPLVVEGIAFVVESDPKAHERFPQVIRTSTALFCANCDFRLTNGPVLACRLLDVPEVEVRNCRSAASSTVEHYAWNAPDNGRARFVNNLVEGGNSALTVNYQPEPVNPAHVTVESCTVVGSSSALEVRQASRKRKKDPHRIQLQMNETVLAKTGQILTIYLPFPQWKFDEQKEYFRFLSWSEHRNLYPKNGTHLRYGFQVDEEERKYVTTVKTLSAWKKRWGLGNTGSLVADAQFADTDYHLKPSSLGKGAGTGGKDLGCNINILGPGQGYEQWQKTSDFEAWRNRTQQAIRGP